MGNLKCDIKSVLNIVSFLRLKNLQACNVGMFLLVKLFLNHVTESSTLSFSCGYAESTPSSQCLSEFEITMLEKLACSVKFKFSNYYYHVVIIITSITIMLPSLSVSSFLYKEL